MNADQPTMELTLTAPAYSRIGDYFGIWSMYEPSFNGLFQLAATLDLAEHVALANEQRAKEDPGGDASVADARSSDGPAYDVTPGGIAIISMRGSLMKAASSFSSSTSTVQTRQALRAAGRDSGVVGVLLLIDSPGGTVAGTSDLAADIAALEKIKPTAAFAEDLCASAAYWCASQAGMIATNSTGIIGSIGTFMSVVDSSERANDMKVKVHVIRAGDHKGAGTPGTKITDEHLAAWQQMVDSLNAQFISGVASGRKMSVDAVKAIADGRVHVGQQAKDLGLVDAVQSVDETIRQLSERAGKRSGTGSKKGKMMSDKTVTTTDAEEAVLKSATTLKPQSATLQELMANLPGADDSFLLGQLKGSATIEQARNNWLVEVNNRLAKSQADLADAKATAKGAPGTVPLAAGGQDDTETGNAIEQFDSAVSALMAKGVDRHKAIQRVAKSNPALHQQFLSATNPGAKARRLLAEKVGA